MIKRNSIFQDELSLAEELITFIRSLYGSRDHIPLHEPVLQIADEKSVSKCVASGFVSTIGQFVDSLAQSIADFTGAEYVVPVVNGTAGLHVGLLATGVRCNTEVITQGSTFIATLNAIKYCGAIPVLVDISQTTLGLCPRKLELWLEQNTFFDGDGKCRNVSTDREITACVPMHNIGHPCEIDLIISICQKYRIPVVEDAAEALGSFHLGKHVGTQGVCGVLSFNGNKIVTGGAGGCVLTSDRQLYNKIRHLVTTAKEPHSWDYIHNDIGYNYRMPALNASLVLSQMNRIDEILSRKRELAESYLEFFSALQLDAVHEPADCRSNYWFNAFYSPPNLSHERVLDLLCENGIMARPLWPCVNQNLPYREVQSDDLRIARKCSRQIICLPSSVNFSSLNYSEKGNVF